jgi:two-component system sensor histidine kinase HydH
MKRGTRTDGKGAAGRARLASLGLALLAFSVLTAFAVVIFRGIAERDQLESRNDAERTMNLLLASLRDHDDFGSAIEGVEALGKKVVGIGAYSDEGLRLYSWGETPATFTWAMPKGNAPGEMTRSYIDNPKNDSVILPLRPFRVAPPLPPMMRREDLGMARRLHEGRSRDRRPSMGFLFTTMRNAEVVYLEIREPAYWAGRRFAAVLFPLVELALAGIVAFVLGLVLRNAEYRRRIEEQRNLVVLGTAASTLAHEIKNPLLSIRLQTRILEKTYPDGAQREIGIINDEVERLSALSHRVGDYLRDPAGNPRPIDIAEMALEVGMRLCGRNVLRVPAPPPPSVSMDPERLRSVLENLVRNALEAGGPEEGVSIEASVVDAKACIDVLDRGAGLDTEAVGKVFDPFFTTKSRGTGIGLSVCKRFVEAAGGSISLTPRPEGGCRARMLLPAAKESA